MTKAAVQEKTLNERLKEATKQKGADMNPSRPAPPPPKEEEIVPDMADVIADRKERKAVSNLVAQYFLFHAQEKEAAQGKKVVTDQLKKIMGSYGIGLMAVDNNRVNYYQQERSSIKSDLLLDHGVAPSIIEACTKTTTSYGLKITAPGKDEE